MGITRLVRDMAPLHIVPGPWKRCPVCRHIAPLYTSARYGEKTDHCWLCHSHRRKRRLASLVWDSDATRVAEVAPGGRLSTSIAKRFRGYIPLRYPPYDAAGGLPLATGSVELLVSNDVIEHFNDPMAAMVECFRVLAPGGVFMSSVPIEADATVFGNGSVLGHHLDEDGGKCPVYTILGRDLARSVAGWLHGHGDAKVELDDHILYVRKPLDDR